MKKDSWKKLGMDLASKGHRMPHPMDSSQHYWDMPQEDIERLFLRAKALRAQDRKRKK